LKEYLKKLHFLNEHQFSSENMFERTIHELREEGVRRVGIPSGAGATFNWTLFDNSN
jgi:hypothetical protein